MNYLIYDKTNGRVIQMATGPEEAMEGFITEATGVIELTDSNTPTGLVYVDDGGFVSMGERPSPFHSFNYTTHTWEDTRSLSQLKDLKWAEIKAQRDLVEYGPFTYSGMEFDGDVNAQRRLNGYISISKDAIANNQTFTADFILADNSVVTLSETDFVAIELVKIQQVADAFAHAAAKRTLIENASTLNQLNSVLW